MRRTITLSIAFLFAGMALAGCTGNDGNGGDGGTGAGAPQATVVATPLAPKVGEAVTFQASQAGQGDTASWDFGDGEKGTGTQTSHAYANPGQYIVLLNLTNSDGKSSTNDASLTYVTVTGGEVELANITAQTPPVAAAASSAQVIQVGGNVNFDASGSGVWVANPDFDPQDPVQTASHNPPYSLSTDNVTYAWDFGDGETATGATASHNFTQAGLFPVKLTVTGGSGTEGSTYVVSIRVLPQAPPATGVRNPTVFTDVTIGEPESLDPAYDYETAGGHVIQHVYETLYTYDRDSTTRLVPVLAAEMPTYNDDGTEVTIKIREDVKFHDGTDLTAEDVKFSLDRIILMNDPDSPAWIYYSVIAGGDVYGSIDPSEATQADRQAYLDAGGVTVVDDHTVKFKLQFADPAFLYRLAYQGASILSKDGVCGQAEADFVDCLPPLGETRHPWMDTHEVGTGPYRLEAWIPGQQIILQRFDGYWGEKPAMEKIIRQKVDDVNTRLLMLFSGQADSIYVPVDHDTDVLGKPDVEISENPSWVVSFIGFNQKFCGGPDADGFDTCMTKHGADAPKGADGTPDPLFFSDINMRKAWSLAFDYETYYNDILKKHGRMLNGALPEGIFGYDESIPQPARDLDAAKAALALTNHSDGFSVTIFYNSGNTVREKTANLIAQNIQELCSGCDVEARGLDWSTAFLPKQRELGLPVFYLGWAPDYAFPDNYVVTFGHSESGVYAGRVGYDNPELNTLLDQLVRETDETKLKEGYSRAVKQINDDYVFLWLGQGSNFAVHRDWVGGYYYNPMNSGEPNVGDYTTITKG